MRFSFVFSLQFENQTLFYTYLYFDKKCFLVSLNAKYPIDPKKVKKCHMFQVTGIILAHEINKYFFLSKLRYVEKMSDF